jgi:hypothetical protein
MPEQEEFVKLRFKVVYPDKDQPSGSFAMASSEDVFGPLADDPDNLIHVSWKIGETVLRRGHTLVGYGDPDAISGSRVGPTELRFVDEELEPQ